MDNVTAADEDIEAGPCGLFVRSVRQQPRVPQ